VSKRRTLHKVTNLVIPYSDSNPKHKRQELQLKCTNTKQWPQKSHM